MPQQRLIIGLLLVLLLLPGCSDEPSAWHGRDIDGLMPDLAFELSGEDGQPVSEAQSTGKLRMLFFGFSHCGHVCPMTLSTLSQAVSRLGSDADKVQVLFVSVDPERDTPEVLRRFTSNFGTQVQGLSGSEQQLRTLSKRYRVTYSYGPPDDQGDYMVYHSSAVFVFDGQGRVRLILDTDVGAEAISADLSRLLTENADQIARK